MRSLLRGNCPSSIQKMPPLIGISDYSCPCKWRDMVKRDRDPTKNTCRVSNAQCPEIFRQSKTAHHSSLFAQRLSPRLTSPDINMQSLTPFCESHDQILFLDATQSQSSVSTSAIFGEISMSPSNLTLRSQSLKAIPTFTKSQMRLRK